MSQLRWTLLILGVVFVAALAWWERRRPRQAWLSREAPGDRARAREGAGATAPPLVQPLEPWIGETELSEVVLSDVALSGAAESESMSSGAPATTAGPLDELPTLVIDEAGERIAPESSGASPESRAQEAEAIEPIELIEPIDPIEPEPEPEPLLAEPAAPADTTEWVQDIGPVRLVEPPGPEPSPERTEPLVEWPPEEMRRVLALRLIAPQPERFPGRTLRLALAAEGFLFGKFSIFHKPDESNRALVSVASLMRPGSFDLELMDAQRYAGLNLFTVLPGPREPREAFEALLAAARNLNERLAGALQDERGGPLTPLRIASLRDSLRAEAAVGS